MGDPEPEPIVDESAGASPEVELEPEPSDLAKSVEEGNKVLRRYDECQRPGVSNSSHLVRAALPSRPSLTTSRPVQSTRSTPVPTGPSKQRVPDR